MSTQEERFKEIADAIREKDGTTGPIKALDFADRIRAIPTGGGEQEGLPDGYTQLSYIEANGTQFINTWFHITPQARIVTDVELPTYSAAIYLFGMRNEAVATAAEQLYIGQIAANRLRPAYWGSYSNMNNVSGLDSRITIEVNANVFIAGSSTITMAATALTKKSTYPLFVFAYNNMGRAAGYMKGKMYSFKVYENNELGLELVPCINPNGVVGMYDVVGRNFFGSFWTGDFIAGPSI